MPATFDSPPSRQLFSIPYNFILYITQNPTSHEGLEKLQKTCKFFFAKKQILVIPYLYCSEDGGFHNAMTEFINIRSSTKFWPSFQLNILSNTDSGKIYKYSPKILAIFDTILTLKEFDLLVAEKTVEDFYFKRSLILDATIDLIFERLPNVKFFDYSDSQQVYSRETFQNLVSAKTNPQLDHFGINISNISPDFSPSLLIAFMLKHPNSKLSITFVQYLLNLKEEFARKMRLWKRFCVVETGNTVSISENFVAGLSRR